MEMPMPQQPHSLQTSVGYWVTRLARAFEADLEQRLAVHDVTRASWAVLSAIHHHGQTAPAALAAFIGIDRAAITRHLDRLEKQGLAERRHSATDRRAVNIELTDKGRDLIAALSAQSLATNAKFTAGLSQVETDAVQALIEKMLANSDGAIADL
jgi:DNA-binding MarR family transcriptional regulator